MDLRLRALKLLAGDLVATAPASAQPLVRRVALIRGLRFVCFVSAFAYVAVAFDAGTLLACGVRAALLSSGVCEGWLRQVIKEQTAQR